MDRKKSQGCKIAPLCGFSIFEITPCGSVGSFWGGHRTVRCGAIFLLDAVQCVPGGLVGNPRAY